MAVLSATSCVLPAHQKIDHQASEYGFERSTVQGKQFRHVIYRGAPSAALTNTVHVYIEGDGVNWQWNRLVRSNPTPPRSLMLDLMQSDRGHTLFVGRPCYFGLELDDGCDADHWTYERYSEAVVNSMAAAIEAETTHYEQVILMGHSGGGALALLIAEQLDRVAGVVTIAGIIDIDAWTEHHNYTRLVGSLNPARQKPLPAAIEQLHLVGGQDENIPPALVRDWIAQQPAARLIEVPENTHMCCWPKHWSKVLRWASRKH